MSMAQKNTPVRDDLVDALARSPILRYLGKSGSANPEFREMLSTSEVYRYADGHAIITEGEASDRMYVLTRGTVSVSVDGDEVCAMSEPGEVFGEFGAITGELRSATVRAVGEVTCLAISTAHTGQAALKEGSLFSHLVQRAMTKVLLGRLQQTNAALIRTQQDLVSTKRQVTFLQMDNEVLTNELDGARKKLRDGLRGSRAGDAD